MSIKILNTLNEYSANKATIVDGDSFQLNDSEDSGNKKNTLWTLVKSTLKTYFDGIYDVVRTIATGAEVDTGTDNAKIVTAKAINDSHNVPDVAPGTLGNYMKSDGTDWTSSAFPAIPVKATGAEIDTGTDDAKFATAKAIADAKIVKAPASSTDGHVALFDGISGKLLKDGGAAGSGDMVLASAQTVSGAKSFNDAMLKLNGSTSGATTLKAPAAAGTDIITLPSGTDTLVALAVTQTLTNKRNTLRVDGTTSAAQPTINTDNVDIYRLTAQTADITSFTTNLSGSPVEGDMLLIEITGTAARAIAWGVKFAATTIALPTTTVTTAQLRVLFKYNTVTQVWDCVGVV